MLIEIFCFYTMFITFVRWRLSVGIKRFTYLLTYILFHHYSRDAESWCYSTARLSGTSASVVHRPTFALRPPSLQSTTSLAN